jgi:hypothetical protein
VSAIGFAAVVGRLRRANVMAEKAVVQIGLFVQTGMVPVSDMVVGTGSMQKKTVFAASGIVLYRTGMEYVLTGIRLPLSGMVLLLAGLIVEMTGIVVGVNFWVVVGGRLVLEQFDFFPPRLGQGLYVFVFVGKGGLHVVSPVAARQYCVQFEGIVQGI